MFENKNLNQYLDTNFEFALQLIDKKLDHEILIKMLESGSILEKQYAAMQLDSINNEYEAKVLIENLIDCDGKIREAAALKIYQILINQPEATDILSKMNPLTFAKATVDINANICRLTVESVNILKTNKQFAKIYSDCIVKYTQEVFKKLDSFVFRDKKYVINKQLFKLYWCLETIKNFYEFISPEILRQILEKCSEEKEYTIREKTAEIVLKINKFDYLKQKLENDDNYYVRTVFLNH